MALQYKRRSAAQIEKRANKSNSEFAGIFKDDVTVYKVKKENWVRIMPPSWDDAEHYGLEIHQHFSVGPERGSVLCLAKMKGKRCAVCDGRAKLLSAGDTDEANEIKPSRRVVCYLVDMNEPEKGVQAYSMPPSLDTQILKVSKDKATGEIFYVDDPIEGYDVFFDKDGEKLQTKYTGVQLARSPTKVAKKHIRFIEENPLPGVLLWRTNAEVEELFKGSTSDDDDDEDVKPKKKIVGRRSNQEPEEDEDEEDERPSRASKRRMAAQDDDEDEDEPPRKKKRVVEEDDEEEEPAPRKKKRVVDEDEDEDEPAPRKRRKAPVDEDDDEEEPPKKKRRVVEEDDEDDEPAPRSKLKKKAPVEDDEDEDEPPPKKKKRVVEEDEDEESPQAALRKRLAKRRAAEDDDEDEPAPKKKAKRKAVLDDDDIPF